MCGHDGVINGELEGPDISSPLRKASIVQGLYVWRCESR
jgi:hypothetical protein